MNKNPGYREYTQDIIIPYKIKVNPFTSYIGKNICYYDLIGSTNEKASEIAKNSNSSGTIVIAETQNRGKGRQGREWISTKGGLWFSIILKPNFSPEYASRTTLITAVSIVQVINDLFKINISIKWPNDIFYNDKKMGGILTEMNAEIDKINFLIIGIGLNINNKLPDLLEDTSCCLKDIIKKKIDRTDLLIKIIIQLEKNLEILNKDNINGFLEKAKKLCNTINKTIKVSTINEEIIGKCVDLDKNGNLILQDLNGSKRTIFSGDISLLRNEI